jgi:hypothetical protein
MSKITIIVLDLININEPVTHSTSKNTADLYRSIYEFTKGYQARTNLVKDEIGDLLADSQWKSCFLQLLNVHRLVLLGRRTYKQLSLVLLQLKLFLQN